MVSRESGHTYIYIYICVVYRGYIWMMVKKMETTTLGIGIIVGNIGLCDTGAFIIQGLCRDYIPSFPTNHE